MEFKELEYIIAIAKYGNITKAAQSLFISQPSLSKYLKNLENNLNIRLFNRLGNRFILTFAGESYIKNAKEIILIKERLLSELRDISEFKRGKLNVAFTYTRGSYMIPETIPVFKAAYPHIDINLIEDSSSNLENLLLNGDAHIAILNTPITSNDLDYISLGNEEIVLLSNIKHPLAEKFKNVELPKISIHEFKDDRFITQYPTQRTGQIAEKIFKDSKFTPKEIFHTRNLESSTRLVSKNFGVCFTSATYLKHLYFHNEVKAFSLKNSINTRSELVLAFRKGSYLSKPAKDYMEILKSLF